MLPVHLTGYPFGHPVFFFSPNLPPQRLNRQNSKSKKAGYLAAQIFDGFLIQTHICFDFYWFLLCLFQCFNTGSKHFKLLRKHHQNAIIVLCYFICGVFHGGGVFLNVLVVVGIVAHCGAQRLCGTEMGKRIEFYHI